ncbi:MAG: hypothetical protein FD123_595 [Bacteroidetes bacterium]|nr:MAG: hypothetical protein FD123_595 [Bacteroidota bacterium]
MKLIVAIVFFIEPVDEDVEKMLREKVLGKQNRTGKLSKETAPGSRVKKGSKKKQDKG